MSKFYVYIYLDPRKPGQYIYGSYEFKYEPFYIGKGKYERYKKINCGRNKYFKNKIKKINESELEPIILKIKENLNEQQSFILECELIKLIGRKDLKNGSLVNMTDGGEGSSGYKHKKESLEKLKKNFEEIKTEFKNRKYILLTEEEDYKNAHQKLIYICPKNKKHSITWCSFKQGCDCSCFRYNKVAQKRKKNFLDIKEEFRKRNYTLLTKENDYKNNSQKLNCIYPNGHKYLITWHNFKSGRNCPCYRRLL